MARVYATAAQYEDFHGLSAGAAPANIDALLRVSSRVVDHLLRGVVYETDAAGMPTDADVSTALTDATCAIAGEADATGALSPGSTQAWDSVAIGNVSLSGRGTASEAVTVAGLNVPAQALLSLADVGAFTVVVS